MAFALQVWLWIPYHSCVHLCASHCSVVIIGLFTNWASPSVYRFEVKGVGRIGHRAFEILLPNIRDSPALTLWCDGICDWPWSTQLATGIDTHVTCVPPANLKEQLHIKCLWVPQDTLKHTFIRLPVVSWKLDLWFHFPLRDRVFPIRIHGLAGDVFRWSAYCCCESMWETTMPTSLYCRMLAQCFFIKWRDLFRALALEAKQMLSMQAWLNWGVGRKLQNYWCLELFSRLSSDPN